jgi:Flp pilus assembly protein TadB
VISGALMFLRPDYLSPLITEPAGRSMLLIAGLLFISGVLLMRSLATVEA